MTSPASATRALSDAPYVEWLDPDIVADPDPVYSKLRADTAVVRTPIGCMVLRREEIRQLLGDGRLVSAIPALVRMQSGESSGLHDMVSSSVIAVDGDDHTRLRRLVSRAFTPRAAARHRDAMRRLVN